MREIVFDTETTGLDPSKGHRIVEIACLEIINMMPTGNKFHTFLDPDRDMPEEAFRVHGLSSEFLKGKPKFAQQAEDFLAFIGNDRIVAHNAEFDMRFINAELAAVQRPPLGPENVVDTLALARRKFPGVPNSLDALCARFGIDYSRRTKHDALTDCELLIEVYAELLGGRQTSFALGSKNSTRQRQGKPTLMQRPAPLSPRLTQEEQLAHEAFIASLGEKAIWKKKKDYPPSLA